MPRKRALKIHVIQEVKVKAAPTITPTDDKGKLVGLSSDNVKGIRMTGNGVIKELEVSISASATDDQQFLHRLLGKIRQEYARKSPPAKE